MDLNATNADSNGSNPQRNITSACFLTSCIFSTEERAVIIASLVLILLVSLVGNTAICLKIAKRKRLKSSTNLSILNLAVADLLVAVFCIPAVTVTIYFVDNEWLFGLAACKVVIFLQNLATDASICNLVIISVEKFIGVCFPFYFRNRRKRVRYVLPISWLIGIVESSIYLKYKSLVVSADGKKYCMEFWPSLEARRVYHIAHSIMFCFLPLILMAVLHTVTARKIRVSIGRTTQENGTRLSRSGCMYSDVILKRKKRALTMIIMIMATFAVCIIPGNVLSMWTFLGDHNQAYLLANIRLVHILYAVSLWLFFFNSACHPLIYGFMGKYRFTARWSLSSKLLSLRGSAKDRQISLTPP